MIIEGAFGKIEIIEVSDDIEEPNDLEYLLYKLQKSTILMDFIIYNSGGDIITPISFYHTFKFTISLNFFKSIWIYVYFKNNYADSIYLDNHKELYLKYKNSAFKFFTEK